MINSSLAYLLDTNVCIVYLKGKSESVKTRFDSLPREQIAICAIVKGELLYGAMGSNNPQKALNLQRVFLSQFVSLPFDDGCAEVYGMIRRDLASQGKPIGGNDLLIASIALTNNLVLVTHNVREFSRVRGLQIEDWEVLS